MRNILPIKSVTGISLTMCGLSTRAYFNNLCTDLLFGQNMEIPILHVAHIDTLGRFNMPILSLAINSIYPICLHSSFFLSFSPFFLSINIKTALYETLDDPFVQKIKFLSQMWKLTTEIPEGKMAFAKNKQMLHFPQ